MKVKLVRDKQFNNLDPDERVEIIDDSYIIIALLVKKLYEEVSEVDADITDVDEYADVLEVLETLALISGITLEDILAAKDKKAAIKGTFSRNHLLIKETVVKKH